MEFVFDSFPVYVLDFLIVDIFQFSKDSSCSRILGGRVVPSPLYRSQVPEVSFCETVSSKNEARDNRMTGQQVPVF